MVIDQSTYELGEIRLTLRSDLSFRRHEFRDQACCIVEDRAESRFHRMGVPEYASLSLLDGRTTISEAVASRQGSDAFSETQAAAFCSWLIESGLASTAQSESSDRSVGQSQ